MFVDDWSAQRIAAVYTFLVQFLVHNETTEHVFMLKYYLITLGSLSYLCEVTICYSVYTELV